MVAQADQDQDQDKPQAETEAKTDDGTDKTVKTYTQEEVSKIQSTFEKKAREAERQATQYKQQLDQTNQSISTMQEQLNRLTTDLEAKELAGIEDIPQGQKIIQLTRQLRQKESDLIKQQTEFSKTQAAALEGLKFKDALALAKEYDIDADELMECNTYQDMLSKTLKIIKEKPKAAPKPKESLVPSKVDSGQNTATGKGRVWKQSEIRNMSPMERLSAASEIGAAMKEGRINYKE